MVKPMVEKSPNALSVLTRSRRSWISGTENVALSNADAARALADVDQPVLVAIDERPQQHAAHQAEDGGVGSDAERQGENHGDRKSFGAQERPGCEFQVVHESQDGINHGDCSFDSIATRAAWGSLYDQTFERRSAGRLATLGKI